MSSDATNGNTNVYAPLKNEEQVAMAANNIHVPGNRVAANSQLTQCYFGNVYNMGNFKQD